MGCSDFLWHLHFWVVGGALPNGKAKNQGLENTQICDTVWLYFAHKMVKEPIHHMPRHACFISYGIFKEKLVTQDKVASVVLVLSSRAMHLSSRRRSWEEPPVKGFSRTIHNKKQTQTYLYAHTHTHEITFNT